MELALGYQGAHGAFISMAKTYGVDLDEIAEAVRKAVSEAEWLTANEMYITGLEANPPPAAQWPTALDGPPWCRFHPAAWPG